MPLETIQIVEDDPAQAHLLDYTLRKARFRTTIAPDGVEGWEAIEHLNPSLALVDVMLPGIDGYTLCRRLRDDTRFQDLPIILLSALGNEEHRVAGFEAGADDFIVKPFSPREVVARVQAILMRDRATLPRIDRYGHGALVLKSGYFVAQIAGHTVTLSGGEGTVLRRLAERVSQIVSIEELAALVWGEDGVIRDKHLATLVQNLRSKLESHGILIDVVPLVGYRLRGTMLERHSAQADGGIYITSAV